MGLGPTVTVGFLGPDGEWVPVSTENPLPTVASEDVEPLNEEASE